MKPPDAALRYDCANYSQALEVEWDIPTLAMPIPSLCDLPGGTGCRVFIGFSGGSFIRSVRQVYIILGKSLPKLTIKIN
jgi:hypothetical protein